MGGVPNTEVQREYFERKQFQSQKEIFAEISHLVSGAHDTRASGMTRPNTQGETLKQEYLENQKQFGAEISHLVSGAYDKRGSGTIMLPIKRCS